MDLRRFLEEDVGSGDITAETFLDDRIGKGTILCEEDAVVAGLEEAAEIFRLLGITTCPHVKDGDRVAKGTKVMTLEGPVKGMLTGERTALNFIMRMSGISTMTSDLTEIIRTKDPDTKIAGTRKTTPGFRVFEKKAIALGGGWPHRNGLYDMVMIKDNHIAAMGGVSEVLRKMDSVPEGIKIDIEVASVKDGIIAATHGADIIMADHMSPADTKLLREKVKEIDPNILIEVSGNITADNISEYAGCADIISIGALTHSVKTIHFSMDLEANN
jgi:nicotinate-nucleotide pyrophosphorylase